MNPAIATLCEWGLWTLIASAIYSVIVYPLLMLTLSRLFRPRFRRAPIEPSVTMIISALNEEAAIAEKIRNTLALDYPPDLFELFIVSDGSTDRTDEIVQSFPDSRVKLLRFEGGIGKTAAINHAAPHATGEILVFSDATGIWRPDAIRELVCDFDDKRVGCVSGRVGYDYDRGFASSGFGAYQRYVFALRRAEGAFGSGFNASGSIHAIRRSMFRPGPADTFMDMLDPLHVAIQGGRTTFAENAVSMEKSRARSQHEYQARVRIGLRLWRFLAYALPRLPVFRAPMYCFQVTSHKFLRWLIGPSMPITLLLNVLLLGSRPIYGFLLAAQLGYYFLTIAGMVLARVGIKVPGVSALVFFNLTNFAYLVALLRFLSGERMSQWVPSR